MSTTLKDWLKQTIAELEEERDATPGAVNEDAAMALAAMKITLASLEAKPIGAFHIADQQVDGTSDYIIKLPDISSKAFWSGTGKNETFHPETYRRRVKEAIEISCTIARVDVEVK